MITYINNKGEWTLYESTVTMRGGKKVKVQMFMKDEHMTPSQKVKWHLAGKVADGFEIYENKRIGHPFVRKKEQ